MRGEMLILQPGLCTPRLVRTAVREWLAAEGLDRFEEAALMVVSELVSNAVVHAGTVLEVSYAADDRGFEVGVSDHDQRRPRLAGHVTGVAGSDQNLMPGGRGLAIVDALADKWGIAQTADGKRVWARWCAGRRQEESHLPRTST